MGSRYSFSISVIKFWLVFLPISILVLFAGGAIGYHLVDKVIMPHFTDLQNRNDVTIPHVVGLSADDAAQRAFDLGLRIIRNQREFSDDVPANSVISQEPQQGKVVKRGRHISVVLSRGPEVGTIPNVERLAGGPAQSELRRAGFENISIVHRFNEEVPAQSAIGTEPSAGTRTSRNVPVRIIVSRGQRPTHTTMPNLVGEMLSDAQAAVEERGLRFGRVRTAPSSVLAPGKVISQSLTPGANVPIESVVDVVVAAEN